MTTECAEIRPYEPATGNAGEGIAIVWQERVLPSVSSHFSYYSVCPVESRLCSGAIFFDYALF